MYSMTQMKIVNVVLLTKIVNVVLLTKIVNVVLLTTLITETKIFLVRYMALSTVVFLNYPSTTT